MKKFRFLLIFLLSIISINTYADNISIGGGNIITDDNYLRYDNGVFLGKKQLDEEKIHNNHPDYENWYINWFIEGLKNDTQSFLKDYVIGGGYQNKRDLYNEISYYSFKTDINKNIKSVLDYENNEFTSYTGVLNGTGSEIKIYYDSFFNKYNLENTGYTFFKNKYGEENYVYTPKQIKIIFEDDSEFIINFRFFVPKITIENHQYDYELNDFSNKTTFVNYDGKVTLNSDMDFNEGDYNIDYSWDINNISSKKIELSENDNFKDEPLIISFYNNYDFYFKDYNVIKVNCLENKYSISTKDNILGFLGKIGSYGPDFINLKFNVYKKDENGEFIKQNYQNDKITFYQVNGSSGIKKHNNLIDNIDDGYYKFDYTYETFDHKMCNDILNIKSNIVPEETLGIKNNEVLIKNGDVYPIFNVGYEDFIESDDGEYKILENNSLELLTNLKLKITNGTGEVIYNNDNCLNNIYSCNQILRNYSNTSNEKLKYSFSYNTISGENGNLVYIYDYPDLYSELLSDGKFTIYNPKKEINNINKGLYFKYDLFIADNNYYINRENINIKFETSSGEVLTSSFDDYNSSSYDVDQSYYNKGNFGIGYTDENGDYVDTGEDGERIILYLPAKYYNKISKIHILFGDEIQKTLNLKTTESKKDLYIQKIGNSTNNDFDYTNYNTQSTDEIIFSRSINIGFTGKGGYARMPLTNLKVKPTINITGDNLKNIDNSKIFVCKDAGLGSQELTQENGCYSYKYIVDNDFYLTNIKNFYIYAIFGAFNNDFLNLEINSKIDIIYEKEAIEG